MNSGFAKVCCCVVLSLCAGFAIAQDCLDRVGRAPHGVTWSMAADGSLAFAGNGAVIQIIDVSIPVSPVVVGSIEFDSPISSIAVDDDRVYIGTPKSLHIIDVGTPSAPVELGELVYFGYKSNLGASGSTVCFIEGSHVIVVDVTDPSAPVVVGNWSSSGLRDIKVEGPYAYVTAGDLKVLNLEDPTDPTEIGSYALAADSLDLSGDVVFVAGTSVSHTSVSAISVADPTTPVLLGTAALPDGPSTTDLAVLGQFAYVSAGIEGLHVVNISDPQAPFWMGTAPPPGDRPYEYWVAVAAIADHAIVGTADHGVRIIDATDPADPAEIAVIDAAGFTLGGAVSNGILVTANRYRGVRIVDLTDPSSPVELAILDLGSQWRVEDVDVVGSLAVVVGRSFAVVDISSPGAPVVLGETPMWEVGGRAVKIVGSLAYVPDYLDGLQIVDLSDPANPALVGSLSLSGSGSNWEYLDVDWPLLVLQGTTVEVIDVSNPLAPAWLSTIDEPVWPRGVALHGSDLFTVSAGWFRTFDLSDPVNPVETNAHFELHGHTPIAVSNGLAYIGTTSEFSDDTVEIWDVGDPTNPILLGIHSGAGSVTDFAFAGDYVVSTRHLSGFDVLEFLPGLLFRDGFESGDASRWSSAVP